MSSHPVAVGVARGGRSRALAALVLGMALAAPASARARQCVSIAGDDAALGASQVEWRAELLRERILAARAPASTWTVAWTIADGALAAGQLAALPFARSRSTRALLGAGAAASALGIVPLVLLPVAPSEPPPAAVDRCAELAALEGALERTARNERLGTGALAQTGNVLVNAGFGIAAALAGGWRAGAATAAIGWAIGEAQLLTQPTALADELERYRRPRLSIGPAAPTMGPARGALVALGWTF